MAVLFREYDVLANSNLFDSDFYLKSNPDIAKLNVDPLLHYIERGCRERRDPSAHFDTSHYLKQCKEIGAAPERWAASLARRVAQSHARLAEWLSWH
jgi:hypothetical protein